MDKEIKDKEIKDKDTKDKETIDKEIIDKKITDKEISDKEIPEDTGEEPENKDDEKAEVKPARIKYPEAVIEAVLFSMGNSVEYKKLSEVLGTGLSETKDLVSALKARYDRDPKRGVTIMELDESVQMCSKMNMYEHLLKIARIPKKYELTEAVLETLSIVAYKQPVTRIEIEKIRGVNSDKSINKLVEYGLIEELGRLPAPGRPLLFGTTEEFLRSFGVKSIEELPAATPEKVEEMKKEAEEEAASVYVDV